MVLQTMLNYVQNTLGYFIKLFLVTRHTRYRPYVSLMVGAGGTEERGYSSGTEAP